MSTTINLGKVVPEKGVDYFTPEEIAEFKQEATQELQEQITTNANNITDLTTDTENLQDVTGTATDTFSTSSTYAVGDIVVKDKKIYRCITAITTAGAWDSSKWEQLSLRTEQDEQNVKLAEYKEHIELLESNFDIKTSDSSNNMTITDAVNAYNRGNIIIGDGPELEQTQTTGKNIININGTTYTNGDHISKSVSGNTLIVSNSSSSRTGLVWFNIPVTIGQNYNVSYESLVESNTSGNNNISYKFNNSAIVEYTSDFTDYTLYTRINKTDKTVTAEATDNYLTLVIRMTSNVTNRISKLQVEEGTQLTSYESYSGGYDSPSPYWEQDIIVVEGNSNIKIKNKNWFDKENTTWKRNNNTNFGTTNIDTSTTRIRTSSFEFMGAGTYTISGIPSGIALLSVRTYAEEGGSITSEATTSGNTFTLLSTNTVKYIHLLFSGEDFDSSTNELMKNANIQIEKGTTATSYIAYKGQTYPITLPTGMFLGKIGTYGSNYIYGTKDNWKLHSELDYFKIDENNSISSVSISTDPGPRAICQFPSAFSISPINNHYKINRFDRSKMASGLNRFVITVNNRSPYMSLDINILGLVGGETTEVIKEKIITWLESNNVEGYIIVAPTYTDITDETLITQLNNIADGMQTYKDETIVFTSSENLEPNIQFDYAQNPISNMQETITSMQAQILELAGGE